MAAFTGHQWPWATHARWPNPSFWQCSAKRAFLLQIVPCFHPAPGDAPLELSRVQTHDLSIFVSHCWREEDYHVNLSERKKIAHCPYPLAAYSEKWFQAPLSGTGQLPSPAGSSLKDKKGSRSQLCPFTHMHPFSRACWMEQGQ